MMSSRPEGDRGRAVDLKHHKWVGVGQGAGKLKQSHNPAVPTLRPKQWASTMNGMISGGPDP